MVESEYCMKTYESVKKSIGTVLRNPKNPDHLKAKKMCKYEGKKLPFLIRYVPDL